MTWTQILIARVCLWTAEWLIIGSGKVQRWSDRLLWLGRDLIASSGASYRGYEPQICHGCGREVEVDRRGDEWPRCYTCRPPLDSTDRPSTSPK